MRGTKNGGGDLSAIFEQDPEARLLRRLADGHRHYFSTLEAELGMARGAVLAGLRRLADVGVPLVGCEEWEQELLSAPTKATPSRAAVGCEWVALEPSLVLLDGREIWSGLHESVRQALDSLETHIAIDSTNAYLLTAGARTSQDPQAPVRQGSHTLTSEPPALTARAVLAETQLAGRGRRGRSWVSPFGANLYLSVGLPMLRPSPEGLSLVVGLVLANVLTELGARGLSLKWPNDLLCHERKLGGVLVEIAQGMPQGTLAGPPGVEKEDKSGSAARGPIGRMVIGIGLNIAMPEVAGAAIGQDWTDLNTVMGHRPPSRNRITAALLNELYKALLAYRDEGFLAFKDRWQVYDGCYRRQVEVEQSGTTSSGEALGVDDTGALLLRSHGKIKRILSGDVSLRVQP